MSDIEMGIDSLIQRLISVYYAFGIWHKGKETKLRKFCRISVFLFCTISYPVALAGGGLVSHDLGDAIFLLTLGVIVGVLEFKGYYIFFKQDEILKLLNVMGKQSVPNNDHLLRTVNRALNIFKKCCIIFVVLSVGLTAIIMILSSPLISDKLPFNIWFPLDYKQNYLAHWIAHCFVVANELFVILVSLLSSLMWYAMLNSSLKYDILGHRLKHFTTNLQLDNSASFNAKDGTDPHLYEKQLIKCIRLHRELQQGVENMGSFFSPLFFVQIGTSAFCICGSLYILAVDSSSKESLFFVCIGLLYYATLDIFFLMYLGNEIKVSSGRLAYSLYESNWMEQNSRCQSIVIMLEEVFKQHQVIMVAKLYSLSLETFNSIMRGAYSMFNLLNNM